MRLIISGVLLLAALAAGLPVRAAAQLPLFVSGYAGAAFNTDDNSPGESSGGFAFQTDVGIRLARVGFGAEFGQHNTGGDLKSKVYGGFVRLPSFMGEGPVQLYLVAGLGFYRFDPSAGKGSSTVGGSLGPGVTFRLRGTPVAVGLEARFHSTFDKLPRINNQQFVSVLGGLDLGF
jgi:hypothetical protein